MNPLSCFSRLRLALLGLVLGSGMLLNACGGGTSSAAGAATATPEATAPPPTTTPTTPTTPAAASATAIGVATGNAVSANIGPAGGRASSPDGTLVLTVPAGALTTDTVIGIQPITNFAHGKIGSAYRLTPDGQTFLKPVTLTFSYTDNDVVGTAPEFLGAAFQTAAGFWRWLGEATVDVAAKTVSVNSSHFTDFSNVRGLQIRPAEKTVKPKATVALQVKVCYDFDPEVVNLRGGFNGFNDCDVDQGIVPTLVIDEWSVNGRPGGGGVFGTVVGSGATAIYTAPDNAPTPPTVAVSARVHNPKKPASAKTLVVSNITIAEDSWTGTGKSTSVAIDASAEVIWTRESIVNNVATYRPSGVASVTVHGCIVYTPSTGVIDPATGGVLVIDFNVNPPTYHGTGLAIWPTVQTDTCPNPPPPVNTFVPAAFFGGSKGTLGVEAAGEVSGNGTTISGTDNTQGAVTFTWKFTRNQ